MAGLAKNVAVEKLDGRVVPLLRELGNLKRIQSAGRSGSIATRLFEAAWAAWLDGADRRDIAIRTMAAGLAAARMGDLDHAKLCTLGVSRNEAERVLAKALDELAPVLEPDLAQALKHALGSPLPPAGELPTPIAALRHQPRAGVTAPGKPRIMLQPEENHAEHCLIVALYAGVLAPQFNADEATAFWHGMVHHLHSAAMPDAGFTGEILLGDRLNDVIATAREQALAELPDGVAACCRQGFAEIAGSETAAARAFHAADVIDRVLEIEHHLSQSRVTMQLVLEDYELVHEGPIKSFHDRVLAEVGLP